MLSKYNYQNQTVEEVNNTKSYRDVDISKYNNQIDRRQNTNVS